MLSKFSCVFQDKTVSSSAYDCNFRMKIKKNQNIIFDDKWFILLMIFTPASSRVSRELRNLMNITEQALRRGSRENAAKPKASSTRQSDWRVRLPTMTHTTGKDLTVLLPRTHKQPQPPLLSHGAMNLPHSAFPPAQSRTLFYRSRCNWCH